MASLEESHGVQRSSSPSSDTTGQTSSLLTPVHFFVFCVCNLTPEEDFLWIKQNNTSIKKYFFVIKYLCPKSLKPPFFFLEKILHWRLFFWFICRSGLVQRCSYSTFTVEISFLLPNKHRSLTLKTNLLSWALSCSRMRLLRVCLAFRFGHSFPLSLPGNLCSAAPLQTVECQEGRGDRFDSNRTMKRTWSNYFQTGVYLGPLLFTLSLSPSPLTLVRAQWSWPI